MSTVVPLRLRRREVLLLLILFLLIFSLYRSSVVFVDAWQDYASVRSVIEQRPLGIDGKALYVWLGGFCIRTGSAVWGSTPVQSLATLSLVFGALSCVNLYFVYRSFFHQRYIGAVAFLLLAFSPWFFATSTSPECYTLAVFFATGAAWAWLRRSWLAWGVLFGAALSTHAASAMLLIPFLGHLVLTRKTITFSWKMPLGGVIAAGILAGAIAWVQSPFPSPASWINVPQRLELGERLAASSRSVQPVHLVLIAACLVAIAAFAYSLRERRLANVPGLRVLLLSVPYFAILFFSLPMLAGTGGIILVGVSIVAIPALLAGDESNTQLGFLLLWLLPSLVLFPLFGLGGPALYGFLVPPIVLLTCRLLERMLDGQWLDYWWTLGLPSKWYNRSSKLVVLGILVFSFYQTARP